MLEMNGKDIFTFMSTNVVYMLSVIIFNSRETNGQQLNCPECRTSLNREQVSVDRLIFACMTLIWLKI